MKLCILLLLSCTYLVSGYLTQTNKDYKYADKDFLVKQKFFLDIFRNIHSDLQMPEYIKDGHFVEGEGYYYNYHYVKDFFKYYKFNGMLKRGEIFSVMNEYHRYEMMHIFNLFYYSKDWTTFYKNVVWARMHCNEGMFVYALTSAVLHRKDLEGIVLPPLHEICPYKFFNGEVLNEAIQYKLHKGDHDANDFIFMSSNDTQYFYKMNSEQRLSYYTDDVGLNTYYYYFNMDYPFWMGGKDFNLYKDRRGEQYLYFHQQLLARYYLERLSNGLGQIDDLDWHQPIRTGYYSGLRYYNGVDFPTRENYYRVSTSKHYYLMDMVMDYERRIRDVIDSGHLITDDNKIINIRDYKGIDYLGNIIQGNPDNVNNKFYRYVGVFARFLLGGSHFDNYQNYKVLPSALEHYETCMRDPVFYQLYKRFIRYYWTYKSHFDSYTYDELNFSEVKIDNVHVDNLVTYFDYFESDITNAIDMDWSNKLNYNKQHYDVNTHTGFTDGRQRSYDYSNKHDYYYTNKQDYDYNNKHAYDYNNKHDYDYTNKQDSYYNYNNKYDSKHSKFEDKRNRWDDKNNKYEDSYNKYDYRQPNEFDNAHVGFNKFTDIRENYKNQDYNQHQYNYNTYKYTGNNYNFLYKTRTMRLNHQPFTFTLDVTSERAMRGVVRVFMGPKYDQFGHLYDLNTNRKNFVEFDKFFYDFKAGKTSIKRSSKEFYYSVRDRTTYSDLYKNVMSALEGNGKFQLDMSEAHCGFPDRLLLPKGTVGGYQMQFYFIITEVKNSHDQQQQSYHYDSNISCGVGSGNRYIDDLPFGYPFDRRIEEHNFYTSNMYFKDVTIFHKTDDTFKNYIQA